MALTGTAPRNGSTQPSSTHLGRPRRIPEHVMRKRVRFHKVRSADGTVIEAWTNDAEGPTVLLCNGLGTNPYAWPELLEPDCGVRLISWNHRGTGRSQRPEDPSRVDMDVFVEDAIAVLDDARVDRCVVAGWSIGVNTAFELAVQHPERVAGLFSVAGVPGRTFASMGAPLLIPRPFREPIAVNVARLLELTGPLITPITRRMPIGPISTTVLRYSGFMFPSASAKDVRRAVREFLTTPVDWYGHLAVAAAKHPRVSLSRLDDIPTVFLAGRFDILASHHDMRTAAERLDGSEYVRLVGTHFLPLERPKQISEHLRAFAEGVGA